MDTHGAYAGRPTRRGLLAGVGGGFLAGLGLRAARADDTPEIAFGLTPVFLSNDLVLLEKLKLYLERATGYPVRLVSRRTYQEITTLLIAGQLDAAWICGYPYIQYRDQLHLVAVPSWRGEALYQSYLIVRQDRSATDIGDLRGDIHAFSDPDSNSGYLVTRARLADLSTTPEEYFSRAIFTYGHRNVIRAVASELAGSGSVDGYVWEVMREVEPDLVAGTRVLWKSDWLGFPPVACPIGASGSRKSALIRSALIGMTDDAAGRQVLDLLRLDGFIDPPAAHFSGIADLVAKVRRFG